ncbi:2-succinyl-5-enolpyruvyl-6-hydroxy-3-cyclohexene-1-carboxylic-acid synthase [Flavobacteriaceae bacterium R38]|nr:2-succinyl-5-enolpyruvyl-6-hydroxy-3-cyclohexene-1-carboxylic-acid synthase [Flavobacteriaceae bacterium R38]
MKYPKIQLAQTILQLCKLYEIEHIVISPGSRNAPLTLGFYEDDFFKCYSVVDERCAAFFAMGIAQQTNKTVAIVCTSGSALLNYYPAISEAFYSDIPLAVISADRPSNKIDIGDGQTIRQENIFSNHILYSAQLNERADGFNENEKKLNKAFDMAIRQKGPVHINAPFEEPLYELTDELTVFPKKIVVDPEIESANEKFSLFAKAWNKAKKKMVIVGVNDPDTISTEFIEWLADDPSVVVFTETTSNFHHDRFFPGIDKIIAPIEKNDLEIEKLQPELLITLGGMIVSKKIKAFLRKYQPVHHFHIDEKKAYDTFFCLQDHFKMTPNTFYKKIGNLLENVESDYRRYWLQAKLSRQKRHDIYVHNIPFSDFLTYHHIIKSIPENYHVQLSNSSTIRYTQLFDLKHSLQIFCNRGTSGIDGSTSTAIGASTINKKPTLLITGDLSFFYDSNALWNNYIPDTFKIIVINNQGGGIFRILPGPKNTDKFDTFFETKHSLNASSLCEMYNIDYLRADNEETLKEALSEFFSTTKKPKLLEVFTPRTDNDEILIDYFMFLNEKDK